MAIQREDSAAPIRVLITHPLLAQAADRFRALGPMFQIEQRAIDRAAIATLADDRLEVLFAGRPPSDLRQTPRLRWLQLGSAGVDHLLADAPWSKGLIVTNARGVYSSSIGQYVLAEVLRINEHIDERRALQLKRRWPELGEEAGLTGRLARGQTAVIVGYGGVAREVARLLDAVGMRIIAVKARPELREDQSYRVPGTGDPLGSIPERIAGLDALAEVVRAADVVVLTIPLTDRSRGLFGAELIAALRPDAWLINISRGPVVDEVALVDALRERRIGGAVLDVFDTEPLPADSPFWSLPNTIVTPHVSGGDAASPHILADLFIENLQRYAQGQPLLNVVDASRQY
jgi:phosphoglycerate dehydrogenase-like enzyme